MLVLSGGADLGGVALSQLVQASGVLELELGLPAEELLQVLQQLQPGLGLLLQTTELLHQLVTDLCISKKGDHLQNKQFLSGGVGLHAGRHVCLPNSARGQTLTHRQSSSTAHDEAITLM